MLVNLEETLKMSGMVMTGAVITYKWDRSIKVIVEDCGQVVYHQI